MTTTSRGEAIDAWSSSSNPRRSGRRREKQEEASRSLARADGSRATPRQTQPRLETTPAGQIGCHGIPAPRSTDRRPATNDSPANNSATRIGEQAKDCWHWHFPSTAVWTNYCQLIHFSRILADVILAMPTHRTYTPLVDARRTGAFGPCRKSTARYRRARRQTCSTVR